MIFNPKLFIIIMMIFLHSESSKAPPPLEIDLNFIRLILMGRHFEFFTLPRRSIMSMMWALHKFRLTPNQKYIIWEIVKDERSATELTRQELENAWYLLPSVSEHDLFHFNMSDWKIVDYLGRITAFNRRQVGIIAYAMIKMWGPGIIYKAENINKMLGIICGFPPSDLKEIEEDEFRKVDPEVFTNLSGCTINQLQALYERVLQSTIYGVPQSWSANDLKHIGMIIKAMEPHEIESIRPSAMAGIDHRTMEMLGIKQLHAISAEQFENLNVEAKVSFRSRVGLISSANNSIINWHNLVFVLILYSTF